jgi:transposase
MYEAPSPSGVHSFPERHRRQSGQKKTVHVIVDNYAAHKHPKVLERLARHPRFVFHFIPTSASWLNAAEGLFATLTKRRLKRGVFRSIQELKHAIQLHCRYQCQTKPIIWTKDPDKIIAAAKRGYQVLDSIH